MKLWQRHSDSGFQIIKTIGIINQAPVVVQKVITHNKKYRNKYDPQFDQAYFIERIADQVFTCYAKTKSVASKFTHNISPF